MLFGEIIEYWWAGNNFPSNYNLCSMVGKGTKLRWAEVGIASLYLAHGYE
jgi:hypothetical protein